MSGHLSNIFHEARICVVGNGYWSQKIQAILDINAEHKYIVFSSLGITTLDDCRDTDHLFCRADKPLFHHILFEKWITRGRAGKLTVFACCGPRYHFNIIHCILSSNNSPSVYLWLEKPVLLSYSHYNLFTSLSDGMRPRIYPFYNYPYIRRHIEPHSLLYFSTLFDASLSVDVSLFSAKLIDRGFSFLEDFLPHFMSILYSLRPSLSWIQGLHPYGFSYPKHGCPSYSISLKDEIGKTLTFNYGISLAPNVISFDLQDCSSLSTFDSVTNNFQITDLFGQTPVNQNVSSFLSISPENWASECSAIDLSLCIFKMTQIIKQRFPCIRH